jgi:ubiquinone/menaquinone biosynthesis C-methylase UbiE
MQTASNAPARSAKEQFDKQASHYDAQWNAWNEESLAWMLSRSDYQQSDTLLDVATGSGFTAIAFAPHVTRVVAVDISKGMLDQGRRKAQEMGLGNMVFQEAPAEKLPFQNGEFDIVTCRVAAHHFLDIRAFAYEAARVLRPGGRLLIADTTVPSDDPIATDWQNEVEAVRDPSHVKNYTSDEWMKLIEEAGLAVVYAESKNGGITIPLTDWMRKSGCTPAQEQAVRKRFANAPESARKAYKITTDETGEIVFTWQRVVLKAVKE